MGDHRSESRSRGSLAESFRSAAAGWGRAVRHERNLRVHLAAAAAAAALNWALPLSVTETCLIVVAVAAVCVTELVNTSIERIVDLVAPEYSELARDAKDTAAAAVLTASVAAVLIGVLVFGPHALSFAAPLLGLPHSS